MFASGGPGLRRSAGLGDTCCNPLGSLGGLGRSAVAVTCDV